MPSDELSRAALEVVRPEIDAFRRAVAGTADEVETLLRATREDPAHGREAAQLGQFASGRIDVERFTALFEGRGAMDEMDRALARRAHDVLLEVEAFGDARFIVNVPAGGQLNSAAALALAELGRAFGAALLVELVRGDRYDPAEHEGLLHGFPRHRWNRSERAASPPLCIRLEGADCWAGELAQFLDGNQKIVLIPRAPCPPAPLARLVVPGLLVAQTSKMETLQSLMRTDGPAVAALVPEGCAEFVHRPDAKRPLHERLTVSAIPPGRRKAIESWSVWQQDQDLAQLAAMVTPPAAATPAGATPAAVSDPVDRLAAWLLSNANLASS